MEGLAKEVGVKKGKAAVAEIIGVLFMSRTYSHMAHLKTPSYSKHKALNKFYDGIVDLADTLAEAAQGLFGKLDIPAVKITDDVLDPIGSLEKQLMTVKRLGAGCGEALLASIVQEIEALYRATLYKMKELS